MTIMVTYKILLYSIYLYLSISHVSSSVSVKNSTCEEDKIRLNIDLANTGLQRLGKKFLSSSLINFLHLEDNQIWKIDDGAFDDLTNLQYLNLAENWLPYSKLTHNFPKLKTLVLNNAFILTSQEELKATLTRHCSTLCLDKVKHINSEYFGLHLEIKGKMPELDKLYLRNNKIVALSGLKNTPNLTHLYLGNNKISKKNFAQFMPSTLTHLHLENNSIEYLHNFSVITQLKVLVLDHNHIYRLCSGSNCLQQNRKTYEPEPLLNLAGATKLNTLSIANNMLMEIDEDAFIDLVSVQFLNLSSNYLEIIPLDTFENLTNLHTLALSNNLLRDIPDIDNMETLEIFMLNGNEIKIITAMSSFTNLPKLKTLSFASNALSQIDVGSFDALTSLNELDLSGNKLLTLPENWISGISLQRLHLDKNLFTDIDNMSLNNISSIEYVSIAGNPVDTLSTKALMKLPETVVINIKRIGDGGGSSNGPEKCQCDNIICDEGRFKSFEGLEMMDAA